MTTVTRTSSTPTTRTPVPPLVAEPGVRFGIANGLVVLSLLAASVVRLGPVAIGVAAVFTASLATVGVARTSAISLGVITWALFTGFVVNGYGQLTFAEADLLRLAAFTASVPVLAALTPHLLRVLRGRVHV